MFESTLVTHGPIEPHPVAKVGLLVLVALVGSSGRSSRRRFLTIAIPLSMIFSRGLEVTRNGVQCNLISLRHGLSDVPAAFGDRRMGIQRIGYIDNACAALCAHAFFRFSLARKLESLAHPQTNRRSEKTVTATHHVHCWVRRSPSCSHTNSHPHTLRRRMESYSEWRLIDAGDIVAFENVVVSKGFQNRDFQTRQQAASVIDPEILGTLRKEASAISNHSMRCHLAVLLALYLSLLFVGEYGLNLSLSDNAVVFIVIYSMFVWLILVHLVKTYLRHKADPKLTALVESYRLQFLEDFGVELGYGRFCVPPACGKFPGIYLRRPRRMVDEEVPCDSDSEVMDTRFPPIYVVRLIPGEIHIDDEEYDAAAMKVDTKIWELLRSTHQKMMKQRIITKFIASLILFCMGLSFVLLWHGTLPFGFLLLVAPIIIVCWVHNIAVDRLNLKLCCEVAKVVNRALQKNKEHTHLRVEFHTSGVPGREGKYGRRYQFVQLDQAPTIE